MARKAAIETVVTLTFFTLAGTLVTGIFPTQGWVESLFVIFAMFGMAIIAGLVYSNCSNGTPQFNNPKLIWSLAVFMIAAGAVGFLVLLYRRS